jgi:hypothetical protein
MLTSEQKFSLLRSSTRSALARRALKAEERLTYLTKQLRIEIKKQNIELSDLMDQDGTVALPRSFVWSMIAIMDEIVHEIRPLSRVSA